MPTIPTATDADGNVRYQWVATITDPTAPTATQINAGTDLTCWITSDGWQPSLSETASTDERACSAQNFEGVGRYTRGLVAKYVEAPQAVTNTAKTTLVPGTLGYMVERRGLASDTAFAAAQKVNVWPVVVGPYQDLAPEANAKFKGQQTLRVRGGVEFDAVVA